MLRNTSISILALMLMALFALSCAAAGVDQPGNTEFTPGATATELPLTLDQCIDIALQYNPSLHGARHDVAGAQAAVKASESAALPQIAIAGEYSQNNGQPVGSFLTSPPLGFAAEISGRQLLYDCGRTHAEIRGAKYSLVASTAQYSDVEQNVVLGVRQSYYGVLAAQQLLTAQTQVRDLAGLNLKEAQSRYNQGIAPKVDVTKAEVEDSEADLALIQAQNEVSLSYAELNNALGLPPATHITVSGALDTLPTEPKLEELLNTAYRHRPELKRLEAQITSAQAKVNIAGAATKPAVYLEAGDICPRYMSGVGPVNGSTWTVGVLVMQTIWDSGGTVARVQQAREDVEKLQAELAT